MGTLTKDNYIGSQGPYLGIGEAQFIKRPAREISLSHRFRKLPLVLITCLLAAFAMSVMGPQIPLVKQFTSLKWGFLIGFTLLALIQSGICSRSLRGIVPKLFGIFIIVATVSTMLFSAHLENGLQRVVSFILLWIIAFAAPFPSDPSVRLHYWTVSSLIVASVVTLSSFASIFLGGGYMSGRLAGITSNPNTLGTFSMMFTVGMFSLILGQRKVIYYPLFAVGFSVIFLTGSRASFISAIGALLALLSLSGHQKSLKRISLVVILVLFSIQAVMYAFSSKDSQNLFNRERGFETREIVWQRQIDSFLTSPLIGCGLEIQESIASDLRARVGGEGSYTDILSVAGVLGGAPFVMALLWGLLAIFTNLRKKLARSKLNDQISWEMCAFGLLVGILINSIGEAYMAAVGAMQPIYVWVILGTVSSIAKFKPNKK